MHEYEGRPCVCARACVRARGCAACTRVVLLTRAWCRGGHTDPHALLFFARLHGCIVVVVHTITILPRINYM